MSGIMTCTNLVSVPLPPFIVENTTGLWNLDALLWQTQPDCGISTLYYDKHNRTVESRRSIMTNTTGLWNLYSLLWQTTTTGLWDFNLHCEGRRGRGCMLVRFTATYAISVYHHWSCEFESHSMRGVLYTTLCDRHFRTVESRPSWWQTSTTGLSDMGSRPSWWQASTTGLSDMGSQSS